MLSSAFSSVLLLLCLVSAQNISSTAITPSNTNATTAPAYYSAPNTFSPTVTGLSALPGTTVIIINSKGAGNLSDTFTYVNAASTVPPFTPGGANATKSSGGGNSNLQPDPTNLQIAAASRNLVIGTGSSFIINSILAALALGGGLLGGAGAFL